MEKKPDKDIVKKLCDALIWHDDQTRIDRAQRILWSSSTKPPLGVVIGPIVPLHLMEETRVCFINGQFMVVVLSAMSVIEHLLMGALSESGTDIKRTGTLAAAIKKAHNTKLLPEELLQRIDALRRIRNPLVHKNADTGEFCLYERYRTRKISPSTVLEEDAREAINLMHDTFLNVIKHKA